VQSSGLDRRRALVAKLLSLAAGVALAAFVGMLTSSDGLEQREVASGPDQPKQQQLADRLEPRDNWRSQLQDSPIADAPRSTILFVSVGPRDQASAGKMFVLLDELSNQLHVYGAGFDSASDEDYAIYVRTEGDEKPTIVGTVDVQRDGSFEAVFDAPRSAILETYLEMDADKKPD
ncbi:MAG: hypothetical protein AAGG44_11760, partial [Planctomycetota bacterium]